MLSLNQVTLGCSDIPRGIAFYRRLGLELIVESDHYARFRVPGNDATLSIERVEGAVPASATMVYLECDTLDATVLALEEAGVVFDGPIVDQTWLWREARFWDPDGNRLCLFFAGENRLDPPWRVRTS